MDEIYPPRTQGAKIKPWVRIRKRSSKEKGVACWLAEGEHYRQQSSIYMIN